MNQQDLLQRADRYFPGACLGMMALPADLQMVMVRGQGSKIYDAAGKEYIDYMLGSGPLLLGHARPEVVAAVQRQAALGSTFFALNEPAIPYHPARYQLWKQAFGGWPGELLPQAGMEGGDGWAKHSGIEAPRWSILVRALGPGVARTGD